MTQRRRILVVDDERIVAEDISECLLGMGCDVVGVAISGTEAIEKAGHEKPDLILMDVCLQGEMDGIQAATLIRQRFEIPAIFLTAYSDKGVLTRAKSAEPAGYIVKPFEEASLRSTVEIALHKCDIDRALRYNHEWFATILMSIGEGVIVTDPQGCVRLMNPVAEKLTGWESLRAIGHPVVNIFPIYDAASGQRLPNPAVTALQEEQAGMLREDSILLRADGTPLAIDNSGAPIRNNKGEITGAVIIFRDVTEARQAAMELRQYQSHLETLVRERTAEIMDTNKRLVAEIEERKRAEASLAYRAELEALASSISADFLALPVSEGEKQLQGALGRVGEMLEADATCAYLLAQNGGELSCEWEWCAEGATSRREKIQRHVVPGLPVSGGALRQPLFFGGDGSGGPGEELVRLIGQSRGAVSLILIPMAADDELTGYLSVESHEERRWISEEINVLHMIANIISIALHRSRVLKDKRRLQEQLMRSQRMEAVGRLSGGIAHDFNNTLLPIIGYADILLTRLPPHDPAVNELSEIRRAAQHAATLTRQLLSFSKKQVVNKVVVDLNEDIGTMRRMLQRIIGEDVILETQLAEDLPPIRADVGQVEQVVMNLVVNSRDAMPSGGRVAIRTSFVPAGRARFALLNGKEPSGPYVCLSVEDTGVGIPADIRDRIFDPFFSTKGSEGTGLGLSVIFSIIEQHQGGIEVESEVGSGTAFHLYLPATDRPVEKRDEGPAGSSLQRGHGERILLVEDEEAVNRFVTQALQQNGYRVVTAACVEEAMRTFTRDAGEFDMVFSDAILPDGNGVELLSQVLDRQPTLRALLSSGYTDKNALLELAAEREIAFLQKPYSLPDLLRTVDEVLHGRREAVLN